MHHPQRRRFLRAAALYAAWCGASRALAAGPAGTVRQLGVPSRALGRTMRAAVYLPPAYAPGAPLPLLYLFHGFGANAGSFFDGGLGLHLEADRLIGRGAIEPLIIAALDYDNSFGVNTAPLPGVDSDGGSIGPYEDYLVGEAIPHIEARLGVRATQASRRAGGVSMGGFAALHLALSHPSLFGRVGAHSAALWDGSPADRYTAQRDWLYATPALRAERDPMLLAARVAPGDLAGMRFYLDVGDQDPLRRQDRAMAALLKGRGAAGEFHVEEGGHDPAFWVSRAEDWLRFYGAA
jgi:enterochelin esterase-like enzyme